MKTLGVIATLVLCLLATTVHAEYMEIMASQIVTVQPSDKELSPQIMVQWDLPKDLDKLIVDAAVITMTIQVDGDEPMEIDLHPVIKFWDAKEVESSGDWAKDDKVYDESFSSPAIVTKENEGKISADVYLQVMDQITGKAGNFGFILVPVADGTSKAQSIEANAPASLAGAKLIIAYRTQR